MAKTATINIRIDPEVKRNAEKLFGTFGISVTDAINVFLHTSILEGGFPFAIRQPRYNDETNDAIREARAIMAGKIKAASYQSPSDLISALDALD